MVFLLNKHPLQLIVSRSPARVYTRQEEQPKHGTSENPRTTSSDGRVSVVLSSPPGRAEEISSTLRIRSESMSYRDHSSLQPPPRPLAIPSSMSSYNPVLGGDMAVGPPPSTLDRRPFTQPTTSSSSSPYVMQGQTGLTLLPPPPPPPPRRPKTHHTYGQRESASSYYDPSGMRPSGQGIQGQGQGQLYPTGSDLRLYPSSSQAFSIHQRAQGSNYDGSDPGIGGSRSSSFNDTPVVSNPSYFPQSDLNHFARLSSPHDRGGTGPKILPTGVRHGRARKRSSPGPSSNDQVRPRTLVTEADDQRVRESMDQASGASSEKGVENVCDIWGM